MRGDAANVRLSVVEGKRDGRGSVGLIGTSGGRTSGFAEALVKRMAYYTYLLRCQGDSLYAGITSDLPRRMREHLARDGTGAKYTRTHPPTELCAAWESNDRAAASRLEYRLKRLRKAQKEALIEGLPLHTLFDATFSACYEFLPKDVLRKKFPTLYKMGENDL